MRRILSAVALLLVFASPAAAEPRWVTAEPPFGVVKALLPTRLRKAPRRDDGTARVMMACPGTKRPLEKTKNRPASISVAQTGNGPAFAIARMTREAANIMMVKTRWRPWRSPSIRAPATGRT